MCKVKITAEIGLFWIREAGIGSCSRFPINGIITGNIHHLSVVEFIEIAQFYFRLVQAKPVEYSIAFGKNKGTLCHA